MESLVAAMERFPSVSRVQHVAPMDEREFQALYSATAQPLKAYLLNVTMRNHIADDLLQETYCRFLAARQRPETAAEARKYLFRIATNLLRDRWRSKEKEDCRSELEEQGGAEDLDIRMDVQMLLRTLNPRDRELLWLAYVEGLSHKEISAATGVALMSVRIMLFRARRKAADLLRPSPRRPGAQAEG